MLNLKPKRTRGVSYRVRVIDEDGNSEVFASVDAAAKALDVTKQSIYVSLSKKLRVRGCKVERVRED